MFNYDCDINNSRLDVFLQKIVIVVGFKLLLDLEIDDDGYIVVGVKFTDGINIESETAWFNKTKWNVKATLPDGIEQDYKDTLVSLMNSVVCWLHDHAKIILKYDEKDVIIVEMIIGEDHHISYDPPWKKFTTPEI